MTIDIKTDLLAWRSILSRVVSSGSFVKARGIDTLEVENFQTIIPPYPFMSFEHRRINLDYVRREFQWYLHGDKTDMRITNHASLWREHVNPDRTLQSNYGAYLFRSGGFHRAFADLVKDQRSRRAVISILNTQTHCYEGAKDIPCTYAIAFRIRDTGESEALNMTVHMRSNDVWFGLGNDAPTFAWIHRMMWLALTDHYPELKLGIYTHCADSMHIYIQQVYKARQIADGHSAMIELDVPVMTNADDTWNLIAGKRDGSEFSDWLYEVEL